MKNAKKLLTAALAATLAAGAMIPAAAQETEPRRFALDLEGTEMVSTLLESALELDNLGWIEKCHLDLNVDTDEEIVGAQLNLGLNDEIIAKVLSYIDTANMTGYIQIPEVSEEYLKVDLQEALDMAEEGAGGESAAQLDLSTQIEEKMTPENQE